MKWAPRKHVSQNKIWFLFIRKCYYPQQLQSHTRSKDSNELKTLLIMILKPWNNLLTPVTPNLKHTILAFTVWRFHIVATSGKRVYFLCDGWPIYLSSKKKSKRRMFDKPRVIEVHEWSSKTVSKCFVKAEFVQLCRELELCKVSCFITTVLILWLYPSVQKDPSSLSNS